LTQKTKNLKLKQIFYNQTKGNHMKSIIVYEWELTNPLFVEKLRTLMEKNLTQKVETIRGYKNALNEDLSPYDRILLIGNITNISYKQTNHFFKNTLDKLNEKLKQTNKGAIMYLGYYKNKNEKEFLSIVNTPENIAHMACSK